MHKLTDRQKDLVAAIVALVREGKLKESFIAIRDNEGGVTVQNTGDKGGYNLSNTSTQEFQALAHAGMLVVEVVEPRFGLLNCIVTGDASQVADSYHVSASADHVRQDCADSGRREVAVDVRSPSLVDPSRMEELKQTRSERFDFAKLIRMCEELNVSFATGSYFAAAMLTRAILDHVPPIFGKRTFGEVANNYPGSKSFKASMRSLEQSSRNIADQHLHCQIRVAESIPNATQVNFSNDLDVLLSEIVRVTRVS